jgi:hypothetical protein
MEFKSFVRKHFFNAVREHRTCPPELRFSLLGCENPAIKTSQSENIDKFCENLGWHLKEAQRIRVTKRGRPPHDLKVLKDTVYDMVNVFIMQLEHTAKRMYESDLVKSAREKEAQAIKDMDATLAGKPTAEFEEMGIVTSETIDTQREKTFSENR